MSDRQRLIEMDHSCVLHRCGACDVTWRGTEEITCWFCGAPGIASTASRIVEDEPAA